jgi:hypothetical protein
MVRTVAGFVALSAVVVGCAHASAGGGRAAAPPQRHLRACVTGPENGYGTAHPGRTRALVKSNFGCGRGMRIAFKHITRAVHIGRCNQSAHFCQNTHRWSCVSKLGDSRGGYVRCRRKKAGSRILYWVNARDLRAGFNWGAP